MACQGHLHKTLVIRNIWQADDDLKRSGRGKELTSHSDFVVCDNVKHDMVVLFVAVDLVEEEQTSDLVLYRENLSGRPLYHVEYSLWKKCRGWLSDITEWQVSDSDRETLGAEV